MSRKPLYLIATVVVCVIASAIFAQNQNYVPDVTFTGSALTGWHPLGDADWHANNGQISAIPKRETGGWLVHDHSKRAVACTQMYMKADIDQPINSPNIMSTQLWRQSLSAEADNASWRLQNTEH